MGRLIEFPCNSEMLDYALEQQYDDYYGEEDYDYGCNLDCEGLEFDGRVNVRVGVVGWLREVVRNVLVVILRRL